MNKEFKAFCFLIDEYNSAMSTFNTSIRNVYANIIVNMTFNNRIASNEFFRDVTSHIYNNNYIKIESLRYDRRFKLFDQFYTSIAGSYINSYNNTQKALVKLIMKEWLDYDKFVEACNSWRSL